VRGQLKTLQHHLANEFTDVTLIFQMDEVNSWQPPLLSENEINEIAEETSWMPHVRPNIFPRKFPVK